MIALVRTEWVKAVWRMRTLVTAGVLIALPVLITFALHARGNRPERNPNGEGFFRLARLSGLMVAPAVLAAMSGFLLVIVAGMLAGDSVAGDASSGNLRYLLLRPVSRAKLLVAKATVAGALIWAVTIIVTLAALAAGTVLFGWHAVRVPTFPGGAGLDFSTNALLARIAFSTAYVALGYTALLALGTLFSTLTDSPAGAIGASVGVYIVSSILDSITAFGQLRYGLPTHYSGSWQAIFTRNQFSSDLVAGVGVQIAYLLAFGGLAIWSFSRKDIAS